MHEGGGWHFPPQKGSWRGILDVKRAKVGQNDPKSVLRSLISHELGQSVIEEVYLELEGWEV